MLDKEFKTLSEKILNHNRGGDEEDYFVLPKEDVKEFIKKLKEDINKQYGNYGIIPTIFKKIDKLAGEELIWIIKIWLMN